mmetsp:Transcript_56355/g.98958  ORF Transcript_56355/g.98958 Transcript_56355/m.98958 type:complete len:238 (+) Transcript_56355:99-812(+)
MNTKLLIHSVLGEHTHAQKFVVFHHVLHAQPTETSHNCGQFPFTQHDSICLKNGQKVWRENGPTLRGNLVLLELVPQGPPDWCQELVALLTQAQYLGMILRQQGFLFRHRQIVGTLFIGRRNRCGGLGGLDGLQTGHHVGLLPVRVRRVLGALVPIIPRMHGVNWLQLGRFRQFGALEQCQCTLGLAQRVRRSTAGLIVEVRPEQVKVVHEPVGQSVGICQLAHGLCGHRLVQVALL